MKRRPWRWSGVALAVCASVLLVSCRSETAASRRVQVLEKKSASGVALVLLPGGEFLMGSSHNRPDEMEQHRATVGPFAIDKYEVLQSEYARLEHPDPSNFKSPDRPVEQISWSLAALFCNRRSREEGLVPCYDEITFACDTEASGYRLPSEAEWEYACRAGDDSDRPSSAGQPPSRFDSRVCYAGNSGKRTATAGSRKPNAWGIHDLLGNVLEWCEDVYDPMAYPGSGRLEDPTRGKHRVLRGGSFAHDAIDCRPARRFHDTPGIDDACFAKNTYGFRCVRRLSTEELQELQSDQSDVEDD